ncbi:MAG: HAD-IA family hydrolase [Myxococcota bacterium]|nr:HAD-IA family hydrolase [Myxococcota bacterium]
MIKAVLFDVGGTLITPNPSVAAIYKKFGEPFGLEATENELKLAFASAWPRYEGFGKAAATQLSHDSESIKNRWQVLVEDVFDQVAFTGDRDSCFLALYHAFERPEVWKIYPDVFPVIDALNQLGMNLGLISNWDARLRPLLKDLDLENHFEPIIISCEVGVEKPKTEIFEAARKQCNCLFSEIVYIGDQADFDVFAPKKLGMKAYLIDRDKRSSIPHRLDSLLDIIKEIRSS